MNEAVTIYFGRVVRELRLTAGISQERLGELAGLQRNYISSLELGQKQPSLLTVFKIAKALDMPADELVTKIIQMMDK